MLLVYVRLILEVSCGSTYGAVCRRSYGLYEGLADVRVFALIFITLEQLIEELGRVLHVSNKVVERVVHFVAHEVLRVLGLGSVI